MESGGTMSAEGMPSTSNIEETDALTSMMAFERGHTSRQDLQTPESNTTGYRTLHRRQHRTHESSDTPSNPDSPQNESRLLMRQETADLGTLASTQLALHTHQTSSSSDQQITTARMGENSSSSQPEPGLRRQPTESWDLASVRVPRDEFTCPITRSFMSDPVVAADGFTYEAEAISNWLQTHNTSPMTGLPMGKGLLPNRNLRELANRLLEEGGEGLYQPVEGGTGGLRPLVRERVVTLTCVGPMNSELVGRTYRVDRNGAVGGRKRPEDDGGRRVILLPDATVSRTHFEISAIENTNDYAIVDCGSAGGTYMRLHYPTAHVLEPGLSFLVGNHQMTVFAAPALGADTAVSTRSTTPEAGVAAAPVSSIATSSLLGESKQDDYNNEDVAAAAQEPEQTQVQVDDAHANADCTVRSSGGERVGGVMRVEGSGATSECADSCVADTGSVMGGGRRIVIKCTSPMDSPFIDREFVITENGASLGRRHTNDIAFCREVNGTMYGLDGAISGMHARIEFVNGNFQLIDGTCERKSTNGTWVRLADRNSGGEALVLSSGMEFLVGATLRFQVKLEEVILERT